MSYLGKSHNLWHRMTLNLEKLAIEQQSQMALNKSRRDNLECYDVETEAAPHQVQIVSLFLYRLLLIIFSGTG